MSWYTNTSHHPAGAYTHHDAHQSIAPNGVPSYSAPHAQSPRNQHDFQNSNGVIASFHTHYGASREFNAADYEGAAYGQHIPSQYQQQPQFHSEPAWPYDNQVYHVNHNPYIQQHQHHQAKPAGASKDKQFNPREIHASFSYAQPHGYDNNGFDDFGGYPSTHKSQPHFRQCATQAAPPHHAGKTSVGTGTGVYSSPSTHDPRRPSTNPFDASHLHFQHAPYPATPPSAPTTTASAASACMRSAPPPASSTRAPGSRAVGPAGCAAGGRGGPVYSSSMPVSPGGARAYPHQPQYPLQHSTQRPPQYMSQHPAQHLPQQPPPRASQFSSAHHPPPHQTAHPSLHPAQHSAASAPAWRAGAGAAGDDFNPRASTSADAAVGQAAEGALVRDSNARSPPAQQHPGTRGYQPRRAPAPFNAMHGGLKPVAAARTDDFDPRGSEVAPAPKVAPVLERRMSSASQGALDSLGKYSDRLGEIVWEVESVEGKLASGELHGRVELGKAKTALGQLNGVLEKLQLDGVDSITVGDLGSGKEQARAARKKLNNSIEELVPRIMDLNKRLAASIKNCPAANS